MSAQLRTPFGAKSSKPTIAVGRTAKVVRFVPGYPVGIPTDAWVDVAELSRVRGARGKINKRFRVEYRGSSYWVDEDQLEPLG